MTTTTYYELAYVDVKGACSVGYFSQRDLAWDLSIGKSVAKAWPRDMSISMSADWPKDVALIDNVDNREVVLLVSPKLRDFLLTQALPDLELLPITVRDHKGKAASSDYTVVNCLRVRDCVDQKKSAFRWDGLEEPSMVMRRLVLAKSALRADDRIIRPKYVPAKTLFREDLARTILEQRFSGVAFSRKVFGDSHVLRK